MTSHLSGRPTFAGIDATALRHNFACLRAAVAADVTVLTVVKADGYGHGAATVAPILAEAGADWFGVATLEEAVELRQVGITQPILLQTGATCADVPTLRAHDIAVAVLDRDMAADLAAAPQGERLRVHVKVDTGMGRMGTRLEVLPDFLQQLQASDRFDVEGMFSHFGNADQVTRPISDTQFHNFQRACTLATEAGLQLQWRHLANSAATLTRPEAHFNMVRPGIAVYGVHPGNALSNLRPVMRVVSRVIQVKSVPAGTPISYGQTFVTDRPSRIAMLPIGYADGYSYTLANRAQVLIRGQRVPVIGAVCMDVTVVDVTEHPEIMVGDEAVLWGQQGEDRITVHDIAAWQGSSPYEVLTRLGKRVPRKVE